ncbi:MAG TPA: RDD family protein, partial [Myxococcus sp.]|nr:RDD family protein [Myxococcus sp.]
MLPPVGDCPACAATVRQPAGVPAVPSLLDRDIQIDRRRMPDRSQEAATVPGVPAFADLSAHAPPPSVAPLSTPLPMPRAAAPQQRPAAPQPGVATPRAAPPPPAPQQA